MFTKRQWQIYRCIEKGMTSVKIGKELGISPNTVDVLAARMRKKVGAKNRQEMVAIVINSQFSEIA
jgi:DNA-binding CsgD family transcriptional regulator